MAAERAIRTDDMGLVVALIASAPVAAAVLDTDVRYRWVNRALCEMNGRGARDHLGRRPHELLGELGTQLEAVVRRIIDEDVPLINYRFSGRRPGSDGHWLASYFPLHDEDGTVVAVGAMVIDDTQHEQTIARERRFLSGLVRVAQVVASNAPSQEVFSDVAREAAQLLDLDGAMVAGFQTGGIRLEGWWGSVSEVVARHGTTLSAATTPLSELVRRTARPQRLVTADPDALGFTTRVAAPITVDDVLWGVVKAGSSRGARLPDDAESRLARFAQLVGMSVTNAAEQRRLTEQARRDPLTGLPNRRAFVERLQSEIDRRQRHGTTCSLVLIDLDEFKHINDTYGHDAGDLVLVETGRRLSQEVRGEDQLARIGGEEFAWLLPDTGSGEAQEAAERARRAIAHRPFPHGAGVTLSAGIAFLGEADGADALFRQADRALYHAKKHGRNRSVRYSETVADEPLPPREPEAEHTRALAALRALAHAIDAKDPTTFRHGERVAQLAQDLAGALGWSAEQALALADASRLHDLGKIGLPDRLLVAPQPLSDEELEQVKTHATLGYQIAREVVSPEQAEWIHHHHERWDGTGYPDGLSGEAIPDGARLIALADAWDAMTVARPWATPLAPDDALAECRRNAGHQFWPAAVDALCELGRRGKLPGTRASSSTGPDDVA